MAGQRVSKGRRTVGASRTAISSRAVDTRARTLGRAATRPADSLTGVQGDAAHGDGRRLRAARNRKAVVDAVLQIVRERPPEAPYLPGAAEVAARAGVSERTVFRHFADLDSLFLAVAALQRPVHVEYLGRRPTDADLAVRIETITRLRAKLYEEIAPIRRLAVRLSTTRPVVAAQLREAHVAARSQLAETFAPELSQVSGSARTDALDTLDLATSWSAWDHLRSDQGCSSLRARRIVAGMVTANLASAAGSPGVAGVAGAPRLKRRRG